jgi:phosphatidylserine/phosphatidylglycerophosphate/cardiolipin synthase-like enzyme
VTVCFTPGEDCEGRIVHVIGEARKQTPIQAYGFTSPPILDAVKAAAGRGVEVLVILDKSNDRGRYSGATFLQNAGVPAWIDTAPGVAHSKVMVIEHMLTITGSYNFTRSAEKRNAENLLVISSRRLRRASKRTGIVGCGRRGPMEACRLRANEPIPWKRGGLLGAREIDYRALATFLD